jgi:glyoxylase-like metal-dependent hydrolase (beta-lactamase superfamily II)
MHNGNWEATLLELKRFDPPLSHFVATTGPAEIIHAAVNVLLLRRPGETVLVDTGTGVMAELVDGLHMDLMNALRLQGVTPHDVDLVVVTHFDGDHVGGAMKGTWPDDLTPAFPRARVLASTAEIEWSRRGASGRPFEGGPIAVEALAAVLETVDGEAEIATGIRLRPAAGHTPGHSVIEVDRRVPLVFTGDLIHAISLAENPRVAVHDRDQTVGLETRRRLLTEFADRQVDVLASHIPGPAPARVERADDGFRWVARAC